MHMAWLALGGMLCSLQLSTGSFPRPLSPQEEQKYLERAATGDIEARNILIERNLRLVAHIMKKYYAAESDQEDMISIGTIGLIKAVSSYKLDKNIRLATYASRCIENAILSPATFRGAGWGVGAFWSGFRPISTSFPTPMIPMCGMLPYISIAFPCALRESARRPGSSVDMSRSSPSRTGSAGCATAGD